MIGEAVDTYVSSLMEKIQIFKHSNQNLLHFKTPITFDARRHVIVKKTPEEQSEVPKQENPVEPISEPEEDPESDPESDRALSISAQVSMWKCENVIGHV